MSLHHLRRLAGLPTLLESIADTPELNLEIERRLDSLPENIRTSVLDALEALKDATGPLTTQEWAERVRTVHGDPNMKMGEVLKAAVTQFPFVVSRTAPKTYEWRVVASSSEELVDPDTQEAIGSQVELTQDAFDIMREMGSFSAHDLERRLNAETGLPMMVVRAFVEHLLTNFESMLTRDGETYTVKEEPPATRDGTMRLLRDLTARRG